MLSFIAETYVFKIKRLDPVVIEKTYDKNYAKFCFSLLPNVDSTKKYKLWLYISRVYVLTI